MSLVVNALLQRNLVAAPLKLSNEDCNFALIGVPSQNPNLVNAESGQTTNGYDFLSNGFKIRASHSTRNTSGGTYIYMAFAQAPLVGSNGVTAKAR